MGMDFSVWMGFLWFYLGRVYQMVEFAGSRGTDTDTGLWGVRYQRVSLSVWSVWETRSIAKPRREEHVLYSSRGRCQRLSSPSVSRIPRYLPTAHANNDAIPQQAKCAQPLSSPTPKRQEPHMSFMLVPCFLVSSARPLVSSCSRLMLASVDPPAGSCRSALMLSSLLDASSAFQWPLPCFCLAIESCLCFSLASGEGSAGLGVRLGAAGGQRGGRGAGAYRRSP